MINEAALLAARRSKKAISMSEVEEAVDRVMAGPERKSRVMDEKEKRLIAYHEGGHAIVAHVLPNTDEVHKITVDPARPRRSATPSRCPRWTSSS